jgi:hypothetical protein
MEPSFRDLKGLLGLEKGMSKKLESPEKRIAFMLLAYAVGLRIGETIRDEVYRGKKAPGLLGVFYPPPAPAPAEAQAIFEAHPAGPGPVQGHRPRPFPNLLPEGQLSIHPGASRLHHLGQHLHSGGRRPAGSELPSRLVELSPEHGEQRAPDSGTMLVPERPSRGHPVGELQPDPPSGPSGGRRVGFGGFADQVTPGDGHLRGNRHLGGGGRSYDPGRSCPSRR